MGNYYILLVIRFLCKKLTHKSSLKTSMMAIALFLGLLSERHVEKTGDKSVIFSPPKVQYFAVREQLING